VLNVSGPLQVIAGAGSGKTRVITARILNLILHNNVPPSAVVALTFTNKAAQEMLERVKHHLGHQAQMPFIGTFHAYCLNLLKKNAFSTKKEPFTMLDEEDQQKLIKSILIRANLHKQITPKQVSYQISQIKNIHSQDPQAQHHFFTHPLLKEVYLAYEQEKRISNCFDFDDLLLESLKLFRTNQIFKQTFQERIRHILVDEYQDTNVVQHALLLEMTQKDKALAIDSICVVGDEDQSIYSWRGATITNMLNFGKDFKNTCTVKLEQNYRSVQPILSLANNIIQHNTQRSPKKLWSEKTARNRICTITCLSEYHEANLLAEFIQIASKHQKRNSIAILYRTHAQSRAHEESLIKYAIPYKIIGNTQFYERKEIKDMLAHLRLIANPLDRVSFFRVLNVPGRGLGEKVEELLYNEWNLQPLFTFDQLIDYVIEKSLIPAHKQKALRDFKEIFNSLDITNKPSNVIEHVINRCAYFSYLKDHYEELLHATKYFESTRNPAQIDTFLDEVALMQDSLRATSDDNDTVFIMTLHAAKGLEFDTVMLVGLEEGLLPSARSLNNFEAIEEERRLFYVGITRAQERLIITRCQYRYTYGSMVDQHASRFLDNIPQGHSNEQDARKWNTIQQHAFFKEWLGITTTPFYAAQPKPIQKESVIPKPTESRPWKKHQPVKHNTYGVGTIENIEERQDGQTFLMVRFKAGIKKILASFLQSF
jgi:DNA helicase-2/ATP-dependent DNA helicase PcrA